MKRLMIIAAATAFLLGCSKKDKEKKEQPANPPVSQVVVDAAPAAPADPPAQPAGADEDDLPTEPDFEEEASAEINKDNLEAELKKLEEELPEDDA